MRVLPAWLLSLLWLLLPVPSLAAPPPLMLAGEYRAGIDIADYYVSEKLDGVRGRWDGRALWTRGGHRINAPDWFTAGWPQVALDGELWIGHGHFDETSGLARRSDAGHPAWHEVWFMVFDLPEHPDVFSGRLEAMRELLASAGIDWLRPVEQFFVADAHELEQWMQAVVAAGGEGLMLHHRDAHYRAGRSAGLLKYKPWQDAEAQVVGHTAGRGKYRGMTGALLVERPDGLRFRIGSGLSDTLRATPPPVGAYVTYRYNGLTGNGVPRFARFMRVREEMPPPGPE